MTSRPVVHHAIQIKCLLRFAPYRFRFRANVADDVLHRLVNDPPFAFAIGDGNVIVSPWGLSVCGEVPEHLRALAHQLITNYLQADFMTLVCCGAVTLRGIDDRKRECPIDRTIVHQCEWDWHNNVVVLPDLTRIYNVKATGPEISYFHDPREAARIDEAVSLLRAQKKRLLKRDAAPRKMLGFLVCEPRPVRSIKGLPNNVRFDDDVSSRRALNWALAFLEPIRHLIFSRADLAEFYARVEDAWCQQRRARDTARKRKSRAGPAKGPKR
jgi:hypothetical protein